jgi:hypothetical protein
MQKLRNQDQDQTQIRDCLEIGKVGQVQSKKNKRTQKILNLMMMLFKMKSGKFSGKGSEGLHKSKVETHLHLQGKSGSKMV